MSALGVRLHVRQLLMTQYLDNLKESFAEAPEEVASIDVLAGDLHGEADWGLAN